MEGGVHQTWLFVLDFDDSSVSAEAVVLDSKVAMGQGLVQVLSAEKWDY